ncbi:MAG: hypothetical protein FJ217_08895 [Ignavibacteria bacterium]|nr:hypothetical protein [Ignavibacteria bacterium]
MRRAIGVLLVLVFLLSEGLAQLPQPDQNQSQTKSAINSPVQRPVRPVRRSSSSFQSMIAYGSFALGDEERFGPMMLVQYSFNRTSRPQFDLFAGVLFRTGSSSPIDEREYVPLASHFAYPYRSYPSYGDYYTDPYYRRPLVSIGAAFFGADVSLYLAEGDVRPYVGFGASFAFWSHLNSVSGTIAPNLKAGLDVRVADSFSAFGEVRRMFGVPTFIGPTTPKFDGLTAAAIGLAFAPRF